MARTDTLPHFLTDVADAIREKTGESGTIQASNFDTAISNISGGASPTTQAELESAMADLCDTFSNNLITEKTANYNTYTNENVTLYCPGVGFDTYVIRYRNGYYQILWFNDKALVKLKNDNTFSLRQYRVADDPNHPGFVEKPIHTIESYYLNGYGTGNDIPTLEEAIQMIQSSSTTYSYISRATDWGYAKYTDDYPIPYTNMPLLNSNDEFITGQKISSNETITT